MCLTSEAPVDESFAPPRGWGGVTRTSGRGDAPDVSPESDDVETDGSRTEGRPGLCQTRNESPQGPRETDHGTVASRPARTEDTCSRRSETEPGKHNRCTRTRTPTDQDHRGGARSIRSGRETPPRDRETPPSPPHLVVVGEDNLDGGGRKRSSTVVRNRGLV